MQKYVHAQALGRTEYGDDEITIFFNGPRGGHRACEGVTPEEARALAGKLIEAADAFGATQEGRTMTPNLTLECDSCDWSGDDANGIDDFLERVEMSGLVLMPHGECPECGALVYPRAHLEPWKRAQAAWDQAIADGIYRRLIKED